MQSNQGVVPQPARLIITALLAVFVGAVVVYILNADRGGEAAAEPVVPSSITIAAAASVQNVVRELITAYNKTDPEAILLPTFGSSGKFHAQLSQRAPFDVFLSADTKNPQSLVASGHALKDSFIVYATGRIAIMARPDSKLDISSGGLDLLADPSIKHVSIANPAHAPYGRAAVEALEQAGSYDRVKSKLVLGDNVEQAVQFVDSGAADIGIVALSLAMSLGESKARYQLLEATTHQPIEHGAVILDWAKDKALAKSFMAFLKSPDAREIFARHGFTGANASKP